MNNPAARKSGTDVLRSSIRTQRTQSSYLKFVLGDDDEREAGDVGVAERWNFVPHEEPLKTFQDISLDQHGNLPRNALATLSRRSQRQTGKRAPYGSCRDRPYREDVYFGKSGRKDTMGFWQRNDDNAHNRSPTLLVLAVPRSTYDDDTLQKGWNRSVEEAMDDLPMTVRRRLAYVLSRMAT